MLYITLMLYISTLPAYICTHQARYQYTYAASGTLQARTRHATPKRAFTSVRIATLPYHSSAVASSTQQTVIKPILAGFDNLFGDLQLSARQYCINFCGHSVLSVGISAVAASVIVVSIMQCVTESDTVMTDSTDSQLIETTSGRTVAAGASRADWAVC